jgi:hypothetical protein
MSRNLVVKPNRAFRRGDVASVLEPTTRALLESESVPKVSDGRWERRGLLGRLVRVDEPTARIDRHARERRIVEHRAA